MTASELRTRLIRWEIFSVVWIVMLGGFLHELYRLTGYWKPIGLIAPVNESVWEHMKMSFWPGLFIVLVQYFFMRQRVANFWLAKFVLLALTAFLIFTTFVIYVQIAEALGGCATAGPTALLGTICAVAAQYVCARMILAEEYSYSASHFLPVGYLVLVAAFSVLSYFPPPLYMFEHHDNYKPAGQYGLEADREQSEPGPGDCGYES